MDKYESQCADLGADEFNHLLFQIPSKQVVQKDKYVILKVNEFECQENEKIPEHALVVFASHRDRKWLACRVFWHDDKVLKTDTFGLSAGGVKVRRLCDFPREREGVAHG